MRTGRQAWTNGLNRFFAQPVVSAPAGAPTVAAPFGAPAHTFPPAQLANPNALTPPRAPTSHSLNPHTASDPRAAAPAPALAAVSKALEGVLEAQPAAAAPGSGAAAAGTGILSSALPGGGPDNGEVVAGFTGAAAAAPVTANGTATSKAGTGLNFYPNLLNFEANETQDKIAY